jgi:hypothetical protein
VPLEGRECDWVGLLGEASQCRLVIREDLLQNQGRGVVCGERTRVRLSGQGWGRGVERA